MSGLVGIFHRTGLPIDLVQLQAMTNFMAFRGPDGLNTFAGDSIGLGLALLRTTEVVRDDHQPARLDRFWIAADARLDCRTELGKN